MADAVAMEEKFVAGSEWIDEQVQKDMLAALDNITPAQWRMVADSIARFGTAGRYEKKRIILPAIMKAMRE